MLKELNLTCMPNENTKTNAKLINQQRKKEIRIIEELKGMKTYAVELTIYNSMLFAPNESHTLSATAGSWIRPVPSYRRYRVDFGIRKYPVGTFL